MPTSSPEAQAQAEPRVVAMLEVQHDSLILYTIRTEGPHPEHPHSPRFHGQAFGSMGECRYRWKACGLGQHDCAHGCVRKGERFDRTRVEAEAMAEGLNALRGHSAALDAAHNAAIEAAAKVCEDRAAEDQRVADSYANRGHYDAAAQMSASVTSARTLASRIRTLKRPE